MADDVPGLSPIPGVVDEAVGALPLNRVVAIATPFAASAAAVVGGWLLDSLAGEADKATRRGVMLAASASVTVMAYKWLDGWQQHEEHEFLVENGLVTADSDPSSLGELALRGDDAYPEPEPEPEAEG